MSTAGGLDPALFLDEPTPRPVDYTVISVDDHLVEPAGMFEDRLPRGFQERAPKIVETSDGHQVWEFDGGRYAQVGMNAVAGRRPETVALEPFRFDQMRPGCFDIDARIADMDLNGVWASMNFPSQVSGFCGRIFSGCSDPALGLHATRAWNDWLFEEWYSPYPERIIPLGITILSDPGAGAAEIRRNAARGFRSVALPERPHRIGLPSIFDDYWGPIVEACVETDTVIGLHVGSTGMPDLPAGAPAVALGATLFGQLALTACAEWVWSGWAQRHPDLKIAMSEGGIGWVAMLLDRLDNIVDRSGYALDGAIRPADVLQRNFWFCTLDDPSTIGTRHRIGVENIMIETDYPHGDGTWPDTQRVIAEAWGDVPDDELRAMCCGNAARLFRHPLPPTVAP
ncbi:MAG TPA: amidohydrolase family protein [Acidimicrobiales bacterium]|nr:amidohydrolase family protein [Acidimicrobiales bacterium]